MGYWHCCNTVPSELVYVQHALRLKVYIPKESRVDGVKLTFCKTFVIRYMIKKIMEDVINAGIVK